MYKRNVNKNSSSQKDLGMKYNFSFPCNKQFLRLSSFMSKLAQRSAGWHS